MLDGGRLKQFDVCFDCAHLVGAAQFPATHTSYKNSTYADNFTTILMFEGRLTTEYD